MQTSWLLLLMAVLAIAVPVPSPDEASALDEDSTLVPIDEIKTKFNRAIVE